MADFWIFGLISPTFAHTCELLKEIFYFLVPNGSLPTSLFYLYWLLAICYYFLHLLFLCVCVWAGVLALTSLSVCYCRLKNCSRRCRTTWRDAATDRGPHFVSRQIIENEFSIFGVEKSSATTLFQFERTTTSTSTSSKTSHMIRNFFEQGYLNRGGLTKRSIGCLNKSWIKIQSLNQIL